MLDQDDQALLDRLRRGSIPLDGVSDRLLVRLVWCCARAAGPDGARRRLSRGFGASKGSSEWTVGRRSIEQWVRLVVDVDSTDATPARTSAEFAWRHPELLELDGSTSEDPAAGEGLSGFAGPLH